MDKKLDKSNFGYLDNEFQYKLAKYFVEDSKFFGEVATIVDPNAFTDYLLRTFVGTLKDYYMEESVVPPYDVLSIKLKQKAKTETEIEEWTALIDRLKKKTTFEGFNIVKETAVKFFKQQNLIKVANKILDIASKGDIDRYEECQRILNDAAMAGQEDDLGHNIYELKDKALSNEYTVSIPLGISKIDEMLGGGLDKGKLGLIIAPAGFGKTSLTTAIDAYAAAYRSPLNNNEGFKVLQIYFEDDDVDVTRKHFSRITQCEAREMKRLTPTAREEINTCLENFEDKELLMQNLRLKSFKTGTKSASDIEIYIRRLINSGFKPDLVSIDYFECIVPEKASYNNDSEWTREGITMRKFESMAKELNIAIWIPTQGTKDSVGVQDFLGMDKAGGSVKKTQIAQLIISIKRELSDIDKNRATIAILKNRSGKAGAIFQNIKFNNGTSTISCDEVIEYDDALAWKKDEENQNEEQKLDLLRDIVSRKKKERDASKFKAEIEDEPF